MALKRGTPVSFITKFGNRATGLYLGPETVSGVDGDIPGHGVLSDNCQPARYL